MSIAITIVAERYFLCCDRNPTPTQLLDSIKNLQPVRNIKLVIFCIFKSLVKPNFMAHPHIAQDIMIASCDIREYITA